MTLINSKAHAKGFTIVELMIVVVIIGIIASVAVPAYQRQANEAERTGEAAPAVLLAMQAQERFFAENLGYTTDLTQIGFPDANPTTENGEYVLSAAFCQDGDNSCVIITATGDDVTTDGDITLSSTGAKTYTNHDGVTIDKWKN